MYQIFVDNPHGPRNLLILLYAMSLVACILWKFLPEKEGRATDIADLAGWISVFPMIVVTLWLLQRTEAAQWYYIFCVLTFGILPVVTLGSFVLFGRLLSRMTPRFRSGP